MFDGAGGDGKVVGIVGGGGLKYGFLSHWTVPPDVRITVKMRDVFDIFVFKQ